ncbi:hypothetical protein PsorP6_013515 [Peronosclerospora sorghi]|uniref:Uncharacterized protein n=1 Tax=Peronosclerospora sorghi TaxID=230839 RepID=A0ACC0VH72_9STRA|nr:hypothetical protein PsorP6_013515 [Peronosclerospora sorghi]
MLHLLMWDSVLRWIKVLKMTKQETYRVAYSAQRITSFPNNTRTNAHVARTDIMQPLMNR